MYTLRVKKFIIGYELAALMEDSDIILLNENTRRKTAKAITAVRQSTIKAKASEVTTAFPPLKEYQQGYM